jgi:hypothetical protein
MSVSRRALRLCGAALAVLQVLAFSASAEGSAEYWRGAAYDYAVDRLLSTAPPPPESFWRRDGYVWYVAARAMPTIPGRREICIRLWRRSDGTIKALVTEPETGTIFDQLQALHGARPTEGVDALLSAIAVHTVELPVGRTLRELIADLPRIQAPVLPDGSLIVDPTVYSLESATRSRTARITTLASPGHRAKPLSLIGWIDRLLASVPHAKRQP